MERIYLDTSVFGGYYDFEFEKWTKILFDRIKFGEYIVLFSKLTNAELTPAPSKVKKLVNLIPEVNFELLELTDEAKRLGEMYVNECIVGKTSLADCIHIALATLNNADILVSWNFRTPLITQFQLSTWSFPQLHRYQNTHLTLLNSVFDASYLKKIPALKFQNELLEVSFKHIVNINRIRGYNSVNYKLGHKILEIRTPREILEYEN